MGHEQQYIFSNPYTSTDLFTVPTVTKNQTNPGDNRGIDGDGEVVATGKRE